MKCDSLRAHWIKEVGLPGLTCGRHSPSKEDLDMLALPFDKGNDSHAEKYCESVGSK